MLNRGRFQDGKNELLIIHTQLFPKSFKKNENVATAFRRPLSPESRNSLFQPRQHFVKEGRDPAALVEFGRVQLIDRLQSVAFLRRDGVERNVFPATAALQPPRLVPFVGEEVCERRQQIGAEPSALAVSLRDVVLLQQPGEERLREILRVMRAVSFAANEGVEGIPVRAAQFGQCGIGLR